MIEPLRPGCDTCLLSNLTPRLASPQKSSVRVMSVRGFPPRRCSYRRGTARLRMSHPLPVKTRRGRSL
jgi:hypothetical protein